MQKRANNGEKAFKNGDYSLLPALSIALAVAVDPASA